MECAKEVASKQYLPFKNRKIKVTKSKIEKRLDKIEEAEKQYVKANL